MIIGRYQTRLDRVLGHVATVGIVMSLVLMVWATIVAALRVFG